MKNPYESPKSNVSVGTSSKAKSKNLSVGVIVGGGFLVGAIYCIFKIIDLHLRFPDMWDYSPDVDHYWPQVAEIVLYIFATIATVIGTLILITSFKKLKCKKLKRERMEQYK